MPPPFGASRIRRARGNLFYLDNGQRWIDLNLARGTLPLGHRPACVNAISRWLGKTGVHTPGLQAELLSRWLASAKLERTASVRFAISETFGNPGDYLRQTLAQSLSGATTFGPVHWHGYPIEAILSNDQATSSNAPESVVVHGLASGLAIRQWLRRREPHSTWISWVKNGHRVRVGRVRAEQVQSIVRINPNEIEALAGFKIWTAGEARLCLPLVLEDGPLSLLNTTLSKLNVPLSIED